MHADATTTITLESAFAGLAAGPVAPFQAFTSLSPPAGRIALNALYTEACRDFLIFLRTRPFDFAGYGKPGAHREVTIALAADTSLELHDYASTEHVSRGVLIRAAASVWLARQGVVPDGPPHPVEGRSPLGHADLVAIPMPPQVMEPLHRFGQQRHWTRLQVYDFVCWRFIALWRQGGVDDVADDQAPSSERAAITLSRDTHAELARIGEDALVTTRAVIIAAVRSVLADAAPATFRTRKVSCLVESGLLAALERYGRAYGARHGLTLLPERLLPFMIARFLEGDPDARRSTLAQIAPAQPTGETRGT